ncbi:complex I NDUFA9 subunit family protein [Endothiovibrio diazotrophicus]
MTQRKIEQVAILGGSGFVGRVLARRLALGGKRVKILTRHPQRHRDLAVLPDVTLAAVDVIDAKGLTEALRGMDAAINLVGILNERGRDGSGFRKAHVELPRRVVRGCIDAGVRRLLHMSALAADETNGTSHYLRTKGEGESVAHGVAPNEVAVTSFRPSVIFGPEDSFFNRFAALMRLLPGPFPLACPNARFAPVYVGDVAEAFARALDDSATFGKRYELCGPQEYTLWELIDYTSDQLELCRPVLPLPDVAARLQAMVMEFVPGKPFSLDNYGSLQTPSVCKENGLAALGIEPTPLDAVVPRYLAGRGERNADNSRRRRTAGR